jgi:membrane protease YdiL (CAAX protease family)
LGADWGYTFAAFGLLLAPLWFFGFGVGEWLRDSIQSRVMRVLVPILLGIPYLFRAPAGDAKWSMVLAVFLFPVALAGFLEFSQPQPKLMWQDATALAALTGVYMLRVFETAWPHSALAALPKLFVADLALYLYVVIRRLEGIGYTFFFSARDILTGLRELLYFMPIGIGLGLMTAFIRFHPRPPSVIGAATSVLVTALLVALPEEMFFRGILQNLLETRLGRFRALLLTAVLFGLAHFNKGARFNWRYVLLASIAGIFYGRAWRERRCLPSSVITHTAVDVLWSLWFR